MGPLLSVIFKSNVMRLECEGDKNPLMCCSKIQSVNSYCMSDSPLVEEGWQWYWGTELPLVEAGTVKERKRLDAGEIATK